MLILIPLNLHFIIEIYIVVIYTNARISSDINNNISGEDPFPNSTLPFAFLTIKKLKY